MELWRSFPAWEALVSQKLSTEIPTKGVNHCKYNDMR